MRRLQVPVDAFDILALIGAALLAIGAGLIYLPAAFMVIGTLLLIFAVLAARATT